MIIRLFIASIFIAILCTLFTSKVMNVGSITFTPATLFFMLSACLGGLYFYKKPISDEKNSSWLSFILHKTAPFTFPCAILLIRQLAS